MNEGGAKKAASTRKWHALEGGAKKAASTRKWHALEGGAKKAASKPGVLVETQGKN
jgi:hypothetical protein